MIAKQKKIKESLRTKRINTIKSIKSIKNLKKCLMNFKNKMIKVSRFNYSGENDIRSFTNKIYLFFVLYFVCTDSVFRSAYHLPLFPTTLDIIICIFLIINECILLTWYKYLINECNKYINIIHSNSNTYKNEIAITYILECQNEYEFQKICILVRFVLFLIVIIGCILCSMF
jgi:hypothetical protein